MQTFSSKKIEHESSSASIWPPEKQNQRTNGHITAHLSAECNEFEDHDRMSNDPLICLVVCGCKGIHIRLFCFFL